MTINRAVTFMGPGKLEIQEREFPKLQDPKGRKIEHAVILKLVTTNICGSDLHIYNGRFAAPHGMQMGHEIAVSVRFRPALPWPPPEKNLRRAHTYLARMKAQSEGEHRPSRLCAIRTPGPITPAKSALPLPLVHSPQLTGSRSTAYSQFH